MRTVLVYAPRRISSTPVGIFLLNHSVFIDAMGGAVYNCPREQSACTGISFDPGGITFLEEENP